MLNCFHRFQAHRHHLANQANDVLRIIKLIGVVDDAAALVGAHAMTVNEPVQGRTISISSSLNPYNSYTSASICRFVASGAVEFQTGGL